MAYELASSFLFSSTIEADSSSSMSLSSSSFSSRQPSSYIWPLGLVALSFLATLVALFFNFFCV